MSPFVIGLLVVGGLLALVVLITVANFIGLWVQAFVSGAPIPFIELVMMRLRKVEPKTIVFNYISAAKADLEITVEQLESHFHTGGNVTNVVRALIRARNAGLDFAWESAAAMDLAGRDVLGAVESAIEAHDAGRVDDAATIGEDQDLRELIGARAVVRSGFLPTGSITIGEHAYPATAESSLPAGAVVVVTGVRHGCLRVGLR